MVIEALAELVESLVHAAEFIKHDPAERFDIECLCYIVGIVSQRRFRGSEPKSDVANFVNGRIDKSGFHVGK